MNKLKGKLVHAIEDILKSKPSMKTKFRISVTYDKPARGFDGEVEWATMKGLIPNEQSHKVVNYVIKDRI